MEPIFDHDWHARALRGESAAIQQLAEAATRALYAFSYYRVGGDRHVCEEVVQDTLLDAIQRLDAYDPDRAGGDAWGWLVGLALNRVRRALADRRAVSLEVLWARMDRELLAIYRALDAVPFPPEILQREETRQLVGAAMSQLPPRYRDALAARYLEGRPTREIARRLDRSEKAVESLLARAREAFRGAFFALARSLGPPSPCPGETR